MTYNDICDDHDHDDDRTNNNKISSSPYFIIFLLFFPVIDGIRMKPIQESTK